MKMQAIRKTIFRVPSNYNKW